MGSTRYHLPPGHASRSASLADNQVRTEFSRRLVNFMHQKGWNQADLSRRSGIKQNTIGTYVRARSLPGHAALDKLAKTLGVDVSELLPQAVESSVRRDPPALELRAANEDASLFWLDLNREIPAKLAVDVLSLLPGRDTLGGAPKSQLDAEQLELRSASGHEDRAWLKLRKLMPLDTAQKIIKLLQEGGDAS